MMDNASRWNSRTVLRNLREAQVISLFLPCLGRALIVDLRSNEAEGPLITTDSLVSGPQERLDSLRRLRPSFDLPDNMTVAPWFGPVRTLESSGALAEIINRLAAIGHPDREAALLATYNELLDLEREEIVALIRGDVERTKTLYQR
ncbi:MAG TPA: hypothetical protein VF157_14600 [Chloroflexota bacterium]